MRHCPLPSGHTRTHHTDLPLVTSAIAVKGGSEQKWRTRLACKLTGCLCQVDGLQKGGVPANLKYM